MKINVTKKKFLDLLKDAVQSRKSFEEFCEFIFNYFYAEDDYDFEDDEILLLFEFFVGILDFENYFKNPDLNTRLKRIIETLEKGNWDLESIKFVFDLETIKQLFDKYKNGLITKEIYERQISNLSTMKFDIKKMLKLINEQFQ